MRLLATILLAATLSACSGQLSRVGSAPDMSPVGDLPAPAYEPSLAAANAKYRAPETTPEEAAAPTSLFRTGARAFFRDQRASKIGDILTVEIDIEDRADIDNRTQRSRSSGEDASVASLLGFESELDSFLPRRREPGKPARFRLQLHEQRTRHDAARGEDRA